MWEPFKALALERKNRRKKAHAAHSLCRICGRPTDNGGHVCSRCRAVSARDPEGAAARKSAPPEKDPEQ